MAILMFCLLNIHFGMIAPSASMAAGGGIGLCYLLDRVLRAGRARRQAHPCCQGPDATGNSGGPSAASCRTQTAADASESQGPADPDELVERMLTQSRYALLLRPQIAAGLSGSQFERTVEVLQQSMALVPEGQVSLRAADPNDEEDDAADQIFHVAPFLLDRFAVTNAQYYQFVAAGGYREMGLWDKTIWPAILDMVDRTGMPGPRYWKDGTFPPGEEDLPVVGVCWYEAAACARWLGKRLPTDAEWVKAACWPVAVAPNSVVERRYPWGDTMDQSRANLWGSGPNRIVPVDEFPGGVSVGGVYQLIGNVWEWTSGVFRDEMRTIRGGAFDTYFANQATAQFQSGDNPLARRLNIGFRCALSMCDLVLSRPTPTNVPALADESADREAAKAATEEQP
jgi:iron(II)-dependent oxidoreductase